MNAKIQILGAGLTGMSAAHHLGSGRYEIHERLAAAGGHAITLERDGFRFDRTGHLLHLRDDGMRAWVQELLPDRLVHIERNSRVFSHGRYTRYPYQANTFGLPPQVAYECLTGYMAARDARDETPDPQNFEEFCLKYFGEGFSRHFMIPYNQKLWGAHPREITAEWCSRFVPQPKLEDVIAGAVGLNDRELGYNANFLYPKRGIGELTDALCEALPQPPRFEHAPTAIDWRRKRLVFDDGEVPYDVLISTAPLDALLSLLVDPPEAVGNAASRLVCNPLWYLDVALDRRCGVDLHWAYVPEPRYPFYRVGCYSNFSAELAPSGKACLYVELASREGPQMDQLLPEVAAGLIDMQLIERPEDILFAEPRRIDHAYVVFNHDYYRALEAIRPFLDEQRIISTGRYGGWNYSSMEDALIFGRDAAEKARELCK
ncbi:MAG: FAD-dependent oxidoreductase [Myxococcales bacterium]|jgi:protoporphyrinogen oxidase